MLELAVTGYIQACSMLEPRRMEQWMGAQFHLRNWRESPLTHPNPNPKPKCVFHEIRPLHIGMRMQLDLARTLPGQIQVARRSSIPDNGVYKKRYGKTIRRSFGFLGICILFVRFYRLLLN